VQNDQQPYANSFHAMPCLWRPRNEKNEKHAPGFSDGTHQRPGCLRSWHMIFDEVSKLAWQLYKSVEFEICLRDGRLRYVASHRFLIIIILHLFLLFFFFCFYFFVFSLILWCIRYLRHSHGRQRLTQSDGGCAA